MTYAFKRIVRADLTEILGLFNNVYPKEGKFTIEYLFWQYFENPNGDVIGYNAFFDGKLVAHYAVIPYKGPQNLPYALSVNTATLASHMGKGLFTKLARLTYDEAFQSGAVAISGVANSNSIYVFLNKLNFVNLGQVDLKICSRLTLTPDLCEDLLFIDDLDWRIRNPSGDYFLVRFREYVLVFGRKNGFPVLLGSTPYDKFRFNDLGFLSCPLFFLLPCFGFGASLRASFRIPTRFLPSPWHVILLKNSELGNFVKITGLSMDSF